LRDVGCDWLRIAKAALQGAGKLPASWPEAVRLGPK
jgi:hypothetical protein